MKVTFVYPRFVKFLDSCVELDRSLLNYFLGNFTTPPSLGIPIMAALTPPEIEVELIDDNSGDVVDFECETDLVAINCFTPQATRAFEIADGFRRHGKLVIMGGFFPSLRVDECLQHADAVCTGEVEPVWEQILSDARKGKLQRIYKGGCRFDVSKLPIPRREIFYDRESYDWDEDLVQVSRGCSYNCTMCAVPAHMGNRIRLRPIDQVVREVQGLKYENVYLADDVLFFPQRRIQEYFRELFEALTPLNKKYFVSSTLSLVIDPKFLDLAAAAGVKNFYCTMNVDPVSIRALQGEKRERQILVDLVKALEDRDIRFFGSCAIGRDWDDDTIADRVLSLFSEANIHTSEFFIYTPYPGTPLWNRLERQDRIIDFDWQHYNGAHVVYKPHNMPPEALKEQFLKVWKGFFAEKKESHVACLEPATWRDSVKVVGKPLQRQGVSNHAVVTGVGIVCPIGNSPEAVTESLEEGRHGIRPITVLDTTHFRTPLGGQVEGFDPQQWLSDEEISDYDDRYLHFAIAAARMAIKEAGIEWKKGEVRRDVALILGTCNGGLLSAEREYAWKHGVIDDYADEKLNTQAELYGLGKAVSRALGIGGDTWVVTTACSSTTGALGLAQTLIAHGRYSTVIIGGTDSLSLANIAGFDALKATSTGQTAPFSLPIGLNTGEGSGFWVVENKEAVILRNGSWLAELAGHATTSDAYHQTSPDPRGSGVCQTLTNALKHSGVGLDAIGCINAHGTGTSANDVAETKGIRRFLGDERLPTVSLKSFLGHCMGAAGILEATCNLLAMNRGFIPPTVNFTTPRPGCDLDYVPNTPRKQDYDAFISANYAFGGNNAAVVVTKRDYPRMPEENPGERVVITGLGMVTALGLSNDATLEALRRGDDGLGPIDRLGVNPSVKSSLAGLVADFSPADVEDRRLDLSGMNHLSRMAVAASSRALRDAGLRVRPSNAYDVGVVMGACCGPSEMSHMDNVFTTENYQADIAGFSSITANSTAGYVSARLCLKGTNMTLSPGPDAGLQSLAYAYEMLFAGRAKAIVTGAADEVYTQTYENYDRFGYLYRDDAEQSYRLHPDQDRHRVLGEGAAMLVLEPQSAAEARGASILAEVLGYGMGMDGEHFVEPNASRDGLRHAAQTALERAGVGTDEIDLVVWAPMGNRADLKVVDIVNEALGDRAGTVPLVTTTFNTGHIAATSILVSLVSALHALREGGTELWPQISGLPEIDDRTLEQPPRCILVLAGSELGYNFATVLRMGE
ncbi:MAG: radical SAM protein [Verrucomicrobia bacterium]|jgi:3-oxoacyl-[acyl-carrier-protein] synthase II|nr:radical SAM protein [Verrucomicrobiota bacterium]